MHNVNKKTNYFWQNIALTNKVLFYIMETVTKS